MKQVLRVCTLISCLVLISPAAEPPAAPAADNSPLTVIPVIVRDQNGLEVTDLTASSFEIQDNRKPQPVSGVQLLQRGAAGPDGRVTERFTAYLLDDLMLRDLGDFKYMLDATKRHLAKIAPGDHVSIYTTSCATALTDWTNDAARVAQFLDGLRPYSQGPGICRVATSREVLQLSLIKAMIGRMLALPGLRNIVFVSPGFPLYVAAWRDRDEQETSIGDLAAQAHVLLSTLDIPGPGGFMEEVKNLCENSGGLFINNGNDIIGGFQRMKLADAVYLLTISTGAVKADGSVHQLKVTVKDPRKLHVYARKRYTAPQ